MFKILKKKIYKKQQKQNGGSEAPSSMTGSGLEWDHNADVSSPLVNLESETPGEVRREQPGRKQPSLYPVGVGSPSPAGSSGQLSVLSTPQSARLTTQVWTESQVLAFMDDDDTSQQDTSCDSPRDLLIPSSGERAEADPSPVTSTPVQSSTTPCPDTHTVSPVLPHPRQPDSALTKAIEQDASTDDEASLLTEAVNMSNNCANEPDEEETNELQSSPQLPVKTLEFSPDNQGAQTPNASDNTLKNSVEDIGANVEVATSPDTDVEERASYLEPEVIILQGSEENNDGSTEETKDIPGLDEDMSGEQDDSDTSSSQDNGQSRPDEQSLMNHNGPESEDNEETNSDFEVDDKGFKFDSDTVNESEEKNSVSHDQVIQPPVGKSPGIQHSSGKQKVMARKKSRSLSKN